MDIIEKLENRVDEYMATDLRHRRSIGRREGVHPSEVSDEVFCYRKDIFHKLNRDHKLGFTYPQETISVFEAGHAMHAWLREEILGPAGVLKGRWVYGKDNGYDYHVHDGFHPGCYDENRTSYVYEEYEIDIEDLGLVGAIDGIIDIDGEKAIIDIKSIRESGFNAVKKPNERYVNQLTFYMHALDIHQAILYYVCKTSYARKPMLIKYDPERYEMLAQRVKTILENRESKSNELPGCHTKCTPKSSMRSYCMFGEVCRKVETKTAFINKEYDLTFDDENEDEAPIIWASY